MGVRGRQYERPLAEFSLAADRQLFGTAPSAQAPSKPDFSGQWVINAAESDFGLIPPPQCRGLTLTQREPEVVVEETRPDGARCGVLVRYTTDGVPVTYTADGAERRARMTWADSHLVIDRTSNDGVTMRIEAALSADGKRLVRTFHAESPQGAADWTYVYDRAR
jgi:hypothetical protein